MEQGERRECRVPAIASLMRGAEGRCSASASSTVRRGLREHHGKDESYFPYAPPDAVAFPESTEEVRDIVNICRRHRVPMIPYGVGTSLEGHILAVQGGVCIDLSPHEQGARGARAGPRRGGAGGRDAQAAQRVHQAHGTFLPDRPGRGRDARRHGRDARLGHQRRALRHDARERAVAEGRARRRARHPDRAPREEVRRGLRPDAAVRRLGGHARHHHRGDGEAATRCRRRCRPRCAPSPPSRARPIP